MKKVFFALALLCVAFAAQAREVTVTWDWPTQYCDGTPLPLGEIQQIEIFVDTSPIPAASDSATDKCAADVVDTPPTSPIVQTLNTNEAQALFDLPPGVTYYLRARVQARGQWSNLSGELVTLVEFARPGVPVIIRLNVG